MAYTVGYASEFDALPMMLNRYPCALPNARGVYPQILTKYSTSIDGKEAQVIQTVTRLSNQGTRDFHVGHQYVAIDENKDGKIIKNFVEDPLIWMKLEYEEQFREMYRGKYEALDSIAKVAVGEFEQRSLLEVLKYFSLPVVNFVDLLGSLFLAVEKQDQSLCTIILVDDDRRADMDDWIKRLIVHIYMFLPFSMRRKLGFESWMSGQTSLNLCKLYFTGINNFVYNAGVPMLRIGFDTAIDISKYFLFMRKKFYCPPNQKNAMESFKNSSYKKLFELWREKAISAERGVEIEEELNALWKQYDATPNGEKHGVDDFQDLLIYYQIESSKEIKTWAYIRDKVTVSFVNHMGKIGAEAVQELIEKTPVDQETSAASEVLGRLINGCYENECPHAMIKSAIDCAMRNVKSLSISITGLYNVLEANRYTSPVNIAAQDEDLAACMKWLDEEVVKPMEIIDFLKNKFDGEETHKAGIEHIKKGIMRHGVDNLQSFACDCVKALPNEAVELIRLAIPKLDDGKEPPEALELLELFFNTEYHGLAELRGDGIIYAMRKKEWTFDDFDRAAQCLNVDYLNRELYESLKNLLLIAIKAVQVDYLSMKDWINKIIVMHESMRKPLIDALFSRIDEQVLKEEQFLQALYSAICDIDTIYISEGMLISILDLYVNNVSLSKSDAEIWTALLNYHGSGENAAYQSLWEQWAGHVSVNGSSPSEVIQFFVEYYNKLQDTAYQMAANLLDGRLRDYLTQNEFSIEVLEGLVGEIGKLEVEIETQEELTNLLLAHAQITPESASQFFDICKRKIDAGRASSSVLDRFYAYLSVHSQEIVVDVEMLLAIYEYGVIRGYAVEAVLADLLQKAETLKDNFVAGLRKLSEIGEIHADLHEIALIRAKNALESRSISIEDLSAMKEGIASPGKTWRAIFVEMIKKLSFLRSIHAIKKLLSIVNLEPKDDPEGLITEAVFSTVDSILKSTPIADIKELTELAEALVEENVDQWDQLLYVAMDKVGQDKMCSKIMLNTTQFDCYLSFLTDKKSEKARKIAIDYWVNYTEGLEPQEIIEKASTLPVEMREAAIRALANKPESMYAPMSQKEIIESYEKVSKLELKDQSNLVRACKCLLNNIRIKVSTNPLYQMDHLLQFDTLNGQTLTEIREVLKRILSHTKCQFMGDAESYQHNASFYQWIAQFDRLSYFQKKMEEIRGKFAEDYEGVCVAFMECWGRNKWYKENMLSEIKELYQKDRSEAIRLAAFEGICTICLPGDKEYSTLDGYQKAVKSLEDDALKKRIIALYIFRKTNWDERYITTFLRDLNLEYNVTVKMSSHGRAENNYVWWLEWYYAFFEIKGYDDNSNFKKNVLIYFKDIMKTIIEDPRKFGEFLIEHGDQSEAFCISFQRAITALLESNYIYKKKNRVQFLGVFGKPLKDLMENIDEFGKMKQACVTYLAFWFGQLATRLPKKLLMGDSDWENTWKKFSKTDNNDEIINGWDKLFSDKAMNQYTKKTKMDGYDAICSKYIEMLIDTMEKGLFPENAGFWIQVEEDLVNSFCNCEKVTEEKYTILILSWVILNKDPHYIWKNMNESIKKRISQEDKENAEKMACKLLAYYVKPQENDLEEGKRPSFDTDFCSIQVKNRMWYLLEQQDKESIKLMLDQLCKIGYGSKNKELIQKNTRDILKQANENCENASAELFAEMTSYLEELIKSQEATYNSRKWRW